MGGLFSIIPVSSRFLLGFSIGIGGSLYAPNDVFERLRPNLFPIVNQVDIQVDPKKFKKISKKVQPNTKDKKNIQNFKEFYQKSNDEDDAFYDFKESYTRRMADYADKEKKFYKKKIKGNSDDKLRDVILEYEAVKRLEKNK